MKKETKTEFVRLQIHVLAMNWINKCTDQVESSLKAAAKPIATVSIKRMVTPFSSPSFKTQHVVFVVLDWV